MKFGETSKLEAQKDDGTDLPGSPKFSSADVDGIPDEKEGRIHVNFSDSQRVEEFAHTGNGEYLTPQLGHEMEVGVDIMNDVPGATAEDLTIAQERDRKRNLEFEARQHKLYKEYGVDNDSLELLGSDLRIRKLLEVGSDRVDDSSNFDLKSAKEYARSSVLQNILEDPQVVAQYFNAIGHEDFDRTMNHFKMMEEVCEQIRLVYLQDDDQLSQEKMAAFQAIVEIKGVADTILSEDPDERSNALLAIRFQAFAEGFINKINEGWVDVARYAPRLCAPGVFSAWDYEKDVMYLYEGGDEFLDPLYAEYQSDSKNGKLLRRETDGMTAYEIATKEDDTFDLQEAMVGIREEDYRLDDYLKECVGDFNCKDFEDFLALQQEEAYLSVKQHLGLDQTKLHLREQWYLFHYLKDVTYGEIADVVSHTEKTGLNGLRAFLSLEYGSEMGSKILMIGKKYAEEGLSGEVFKKYSEIVDATENMGEYLRSEFGDVDPATLQVMIQRLTDSLLEKGKNLLVKYADIDLDGMSAEEREISIADFPGELENVKVNIDRFTGGVLLAREMGLVREMDEVGSVSVGYVDGQSFHKNEDLFGKAEELYRDHHKHRGEEFESEILQRFKNKLDDGNTFVTVIAHEGEVIAFASETYREDGSVEISALNANEEYGSLKQGTKLLSDLLEKHRIAERVVHSDCPPENARAYTSKLGYVITGSFEFEGQELLEIMIDPHQEYVSRDPQRKKEFTFAQYQNQSQVFTKLDFAEDIVFLKHPVGEKYPHIDGGYVGTKKHTDKEEGMDYYILERPI